MNAIRRIVENSFVVWLGIIFLIGFVFSGKAANLVGYHFPVVTPLKITSVEKIVNFGLDSSLVKGTSIKLRNCDHRTMNWFIDEGENEGTVISFIQEKSQSRKKGIMEFTGIVVGLPPEKLDFARSEVSHDCFGGYIRVVSNFYRGKNLR
jgi:hypothetical protein